MLIQVGDKTFGWGADVRSLPENADAYGAYVLTPEEELALAEAIKSAGWVPSWRVSPVARVVFLCELEREDPWRRSIVTKATRGQTLQVVEREA